MEDKVVIAGDTEDEIWQKIENDLNRQDPFQYQALIHFKNWEVLLDIDIDLGGGFEGGYAMTTFNAALFNPGDFRFAIHKEDFIDEVGKFFGMQDVEVGFNDFDKRIIVKGNDEKRIRNIFSDSFVRGILLSLDDFSFGMVNHHVAENQPKRPFLELVIDNGITDAKMLREIYKAFVKVLVIVDTDSGN